MAQKLTERPEGQAKRAIRTTKLPEVLRQAHLRQQATADFLKIGKSTLKRWVRERPDFPKPIFVGPRVKVWRTAELVAYLNEHQGRRS